MLPTISSGAIIIPLNHAEQEPGLHSVRGQEERKGRSRWLGMVCAPGATGAKEPLLGEGHLHLLPKQPKTSRTGHRKSHIVLPSQHSGLQVFL